MEDFSNHPLYKKHTIDTAMDSLWKFYSSHFFVLFLISFISVAAINFYSQTIDFNKLVEALTILRSDPEYMGEYMEVLKEILWDMTPVFLLILFINVLLSQYVLRNPSQGNNIRSEERRVG